MGMGLLQHGPQGRLALLSLACALNRAPFAGRPDFFGAGGFLPIWRGVGGFATNSNSNHHRAFVARVDRRVTGEQVCLRTKRWHAATSEGEPGTARAPP